MNIFVLYPDTFPTLKHAFKFVSTKASIPTLKLLTIASLLPVYCKEKLFNMNKIELKDEYILWNPNLESLTGIQGPKNSGIKTIKDFTNLKDIGDDKYLFESLKGNFVIAKARWLDLTETDKEFYYEVYYSPRVVASKEVVIDPAIIKDNPSQFPANEIMEIPVTEIEKRVIERTAALARENEVLKIELSRRKIVEDHLKQSLNERDTLLRENYHRIKNNLQVISSLLNLQSGYIEDRKCREVFKESRNRVRSIALIHDRLSRSSNLKKIEFSEYIKSLCIDLFRSYNIDQKRIALNFKLNYLFLEIDMTLLCGLIINELVSNCLKHAFPDNRNGEITIELDSSGSKYILIIKDNGVGFPANIDFKYTDSLGLKLVNALTSQLSGEIELISRNCTEFRITFPLNMHTLPAGF